LLLTIIDIFQNRVVPIGELSQPVTYLPAKTFASRVIAARPNYERKPFHVSYIAMLGEFFRQ
jgi:hypothetical protein